MMQFIKQYKVLVVGGGLALLLLLAAGVFLFLQIQKYSADTSEADDNQKRLTDLENRQPGPTEVNVQIVASNTAAVTTGLKHLLGELRRGQVEPVNKPRSVFNSFLKSNIDQMNEAAQKHGLHVPVKFDYGFKAYVEGQLPATQDVARLTVQVQMVRALVEALRQAKAAEIITIERQVFEEGANPATGAASVTTGRGGRDSSAPSATASATALYPLEPPDAQGLYTREHFALSLRLTDERLAGLLNMLAHNVAWGEQRLFTVVTQLNIMGAGLPKVGGADADTGTRVERTGGPSPAPAIAPVAELAPAADGSTAPGEKPVLPKKREDRIVAGRDNVTVQLDVDVYRFAAAETKGKVKP